MNCTRAVSPAAPPARPHVLLTVHVSFGPMNWNTLNSPALTLPVASKVTLPVTPLT